MDLGVKPLSFGSSNDLWKSGDGVPTQFPAGLRVLVVDDDPTCLRILEKMLRNCLYEVTTCNRAEVALDFLRDERNVYDVVISDVHMPDMDGFKLLEYVGLEMDLPVIMMSADDSKSVVMKGVTHGACDYLIKPVRMEALKNIWQHVVRRKKHEWKDKDLEQSESFGDPKLPEDLDYSSSASEGFWTNSKKRKDEEDESEDRDESSALKKPRVVWSIELHQQFVTAVKQLGIDKAVPKKILELMNVPGLTRENVASHLQKYRLYLRRLSSVSHHPNGHPFVGPPDFPFGPMPPLNAVDLQALAASCQLPPQSLATLQAASVGRATANQRNIFSFENPKLRFLVGHQQQNNTDKHVDLFHGIPTNMHVRPQNFDEVNPSMVSQPASGHARVDNVSVRNMDFRSSSFSQGRNTGIPKPREEANRSQVQPDLSQVIPGRPISGPTVDNICGQSMDFSLLSAGLALKPQEEVSRSQGQPILQQAVPDQPVLSRTGDDNVRGRSMDFSGSSILPAGNAGMSKPGEVHTKFNGPRGFVHNYDVFNHLNQNRTQEWCLQNSGPSFEHSNVYRGNDVNGGQSRVSSVNRTSFSEGLGNVPNVGQNVGHLHELFGPDLMSVLLKEQQEGAGAGPIENELGGFDYHLDNLPVYQHTT